MSGGSFKYLCFAGDLLARSSDIEEMANAIKEYDSGWRLPAASDTRRVLSLLRQAEALASHLQGVWHAVEWHHSCDYTKDMVEEALRRYGETPYPEECE